MSFRDPDPEDDDLDLEEEAEPAPRRPTRGRGPGRRAPPSPVQAWESGEGGGEEWEDDRRRWSPFGGSRTPVYWRARDSLYFEPLVALAVVVLLLVGLYSFTTNWPPAYVVESDSMEHGSGDRLGVINAGDMVLAEKVPASGIVPYVVGYRDGVRTYGDYGDVVLYHANGNPRPTPIVHRAILYLEWNAAQHSYNATDLRGLPCGGGGNMTSGELYYSTGQGSPLGCGTTGLTGALRLYHVGWNSTRIVLNLNDYVAIGPHSGFVTKGDGNQYPDQYPIGGGGSVPSLSSLVEPGWVIGVARGMVPWFGAIKLFLQGNAGNVSSGSWQFLALSLVAAILAGFGIHYALKTEGIESPIRRREEEERAEYEEERHPGGSHGFLGSLRAWRHGSDDEAEDDDEPAPTRSYLRTWSPPARERARAPDAHGRPRPRVRRPVRRHRDEDDDR